MGYKFTSTQDTREPILLDIPSQKFLKKADTGTASRIVGSIEKLVEDPIPHDSKRIMRPAEKIIQNQSWEVSHSLQS